jgi:type II secretory pathway pseudopilin PulG
MFVRGAKRRLPRQAGRLASARGQTKSSKGEEGQTLIEMVVAMGLLAAVIALFAQAFVAGTFSSDYAQVKEVAVTLADSAIDNTRAVTPSSLLSGTCLTTSPAQVDLSKTYCSTPSSYGAYEESPKTTILDSIVFTTKVFVGSCYLQPQVSGSLCTLTPQDAESMIRVIAEVTWAASGCTNGACYYVASSLISNAADPILNTVLPGAPTGVIASPGNAQVSVSWTDPSSNGGSGISGYDVYDTTTAGGENYSVTACTVGGATATGCPVSGLTNGTKYYFTVEAVNEAGNSSPSTEVSTTPYTVSGAPTGLNATVNDGQVSLGWTAPSSTGGSAITGYDVYDGTTSGHESYSSALCTAGTSPTSCSVYLGKGTYYFTVEAVNAAGNSSPSTEASATVAAVITLSSTSGPVGTSVTISGFGFTSAGTISTSGVTFNGTSVSIGGSSIAIASNGTWSANFTVSNASNGSQTVKATDSSSVSATATFSVQASITLSPTSGAPGATVTISGTGFASGGTISHSSGITFNGASVSIGSTSKTVASNGTWTATFSVPSSSYGSKTVVATSTTPASSASIPFNVT